MGWSLLLLVLATFLVAPALAISPTTSASAAHPQQASRHGARLFEPRDLALLESPDRDIWQKPDSIMDALGIADGSVVADLGAGGGWFTIRLARRVGPNGIVYAEDIQPEMILATERRVGREGLTNVRTRLGTTENPRLPVRAIDAILIVDTYHEIQIDDRVALLSNAAKALKPQGRIGIVEFRKDGGGPGPPLEERVDPEAIVRDASAAGLPLLRRETFLPYEFLLVFGK